MKLLFDQNISYRIIHKINSIFPDSVHVKDVNLTDSTDKIIWEYAKTKGFAIVTFDADFADLSTMNAFPPKIIWLRMGNTTTNKVESIIRKHSETIETFLIDKKHACLEIYE